MTENGIEIKAVAALMDYVRDEFKQTKQPITLELGFHPNSIGPYGVEGSQWKVIIKRPTTYIVDYGSTIEEAAERLLDRVLHPENYPASEDDD